MAGTKNIGGITAKLILDGEQFMVSLTRASKAADSAGRKFTDNFTAAGRAAKSAGASATIGGLGFFRMVMIARMAERAFSTATRAIENIVKSIDDLGVQSKTFSLPVKEVQAMQFAAEQASLPANALTEAFKGMTNYAYEAARGNEQNAVMLAQLGINAKEFIALSPAQEYDVLAEKLRGLSNANERAAVANKIFGASGEQMLPLLMQGSAAIDAASASVDQLGQSLSDIDVEEVHQMKQAADKVQGAFKGVAQQVTVGVAPALTEMANRIIDQINAWGGVKGVSGEVMNGIIKGVTIALEVFDGFRFTFDILKAGFYGLAAVGDAFVSGIVAGFESVRNVAERLYNKLAEAHNRIPGTNKLKLFDDTNDHTWSDAFADAMKVNGKKAAEAWRDAMKILDEKPREFQVQDFFKDAESKWKAVATETVNATDKTKTYGDTVTTVMNNAQKSIDALKSSLMSMAGIAQNGGNSVNAMYAREAKQHRDRADQFEAQGNYNDADRERAMADHLEGLVKRRELRKGDLEGAAKRQEEFVANKPVDPGAMVSFYQNGFIPNYAGGNGGAPKQSAFDAAIAAKHSDFDARLQAAKDRITAKPSAPSLGAVGNSSLNVGGPNHAWDTPIDVGHLYSGAHDAAKGGPLDTAHAAVTAAKTVPAAAQAQTSNKAPATIDQLLSGIQQLLSTLNALPGKIGVA